jgi:NADH-quinone oxidoreductase subunit H
MKFAFFMLAEYSAMLVNCCLMVSLFLGGWSLGMFRYGITTAGLAELGWKGGLLGTFIFFVKVMTFMLVYIWFRATFPRFRFDQLMDLGWKYMIPLALANIVVTGIIVLIPGGERFLGAVGALLIAFTLFLVFRPRKRPVRMTHASRVSEA